jgi:hypothetical protein
MVEQRAQQYYVEKEEACVRREVCEARRLRETVRSTEARR